MNAKSTLARLEPLLAKHAVAQQDVDNARAELDAAKAVVDQAKKDLDDSVVRAEASGRVGRAMFEVGGRVTGPADLLTTIDNLGIRRTCMLCSASSSQQVLRVESGSLALPRSSEPGGKLQVQVVLPNGTLLSRVDVSRSSRRRSIPPLARRSSARRSRITIAFDCPASS